MTTLAVFDVLFRADMTGFTSGMSAGISSFAKFNSGLSGLTSSLLKANLILDVGRSIWNAASNSVIGMNATIETATARFTTLMGSVDAAHQHVIDLFQYSAQTPFNVETIIQADLKLRLFGGAALDTSQNLKMVTDAAAATGAPIANIAFQVGRVYAAIQGGEPIARATLALERMGVLSPQVAVQLDNMHKAGVPASEMWQTFTDNLNRFADAAIRQEHTWSGLITTLKNFFQLDIARATQPIFEVAKELATDLIGIFTSPGFSHAVDTFAEYLQKALAVMELLARGAVTLAPMLVSGFKAVAGVVADAWNALVTFNDNLTKGGIAAVKAYADGWIQGAQAYLGAAMTYITSFISGFLIGASPPPYGPLSKITVGGQKVIEAWVKGALSADLSPVLQIPELVSKSWTTVKSAATAVKDYIQTIADGVINVNRQMDALTQKAAEVKATFADQISAVQGQLDQIAGADAIVTQSMDIIKAKISQITDAYQQQIDPIQAQIDALQDVLSVQDKLKANGLALQKNLLEQQKARIEMVGGDTTAIDAKLKLMDAQVSLNDLQNQQKQLMADQAAIPLQDQVDKLKEAQAAALQPLKDQLAVLQQQKDMLAVQKSILDQQLAGIKRNEAAALAPITAQMKLVKEQKQDLQDQEKIWREILSHVTELENTLQKPKKPKAGTGIGGLPVPPSPDASLTDAAAKLADKMAAAAHTAALKAAKSFVNGLVKAIRDNLPVAISVLAGFIGGGPIGAVLGLIRGEIWQQIFKFTGIKFDTHSLAAQIGSALGAVVGFIFGGPIGASIGIGLGNLLGQLIAKGLSFLGKPGSATKLGGSAGGIVDSVIGMIRPALETAGKWIMNTGIPILWQGIENIGQGIQRFLQGIDWNGVLNTITTAFGGLLTGAASWLLKTGVPMVAGAAGTLFGGLAKVDWVTIGGQVVGAVQRLLQQLSGWIIDTAIPLLLKYAGQLWGTLVDAVKSIDWGKLVTQLGNFAGKVISWLQNTGVPQFINGAVKLGQGIITGITNALFGQNGQPGLLAQLATWIGTVNWVDVVTAIVQAGVNLGVNLVQGILGLVQGGLGLLAQMQLWLSNADWSHILKVITDTAVNIGSTLVSGITSVIFGDKDHKGLLNDMLDWFQGTFIPGLGGLLAKLLKAGADLGASLGRGLANAVGGFVNDMIGAVVDGINGVIGMVNNINSINPFSVIKTNIPQIDKAHIIQVPTFGAGGTVPGALGSPMLALVHGGEEVLTPNQQDSSGGTEYGGTLVLQVDADTLFTIQDRRMHIAKRIYSPRGGSLALNPRRS